MTRTLAIDKMRLFEATGYHPHEGQRKVHTSRVRHRVNAAGRRFGKSQVGGMELLPHVYMAHHNRSLLEDLGIRMEYWIVGPNYTDSEKEFRVFHNTIRKLKMPCDKPGTYYDPKGNMQVSLWGGRFILQAKSGAHPENLVGEGLHGVIMAEAAKMKERIWAKSVRPMLSDFHGWSLWNSTPEGKNYFYELWRRGQDPKDDSWRSWRQPSWINPFVFPLGKDDPEVAELGKDLTEQGKAQEIDCSFVEYVGQVFKDWDEELHVRDLEYDPSLPVFLATDYGYTNPNVMLFIQISAFGDVYVLAEYYRSHRTDEEFVQDILDDERLSALARQAKMLYPDPEDPGATRTLCDRLHLRAAGRTGGSLMNRIKLIQRWLKVPEHLQHLSWDHPERLPKLLIDRSCHMLSREMEAYRYPDKRIGSQSGPENPLKKDDHAPEALSRFFGGHIGAGPGGRPVIRTARIGH